jgi:L-rhamnose-H+ transport protein
MGESSLLVGLLLTIVGGTMEGAYALPLKHTPRWDWEHIWGTGSLMALILVPWPLAFLTVPNLMEVLGNASAKSLLSAVLFGAGWGAGGIFFGLGVAALGLSLGLSLILGLVAIGGSIVPLMMTHPEQLFRRGGLVLIAGIVVMILGLAVCARAGQLRDKTRKRLTPGDPEPGVRGTSFKVGLIFCIASGLLSALVNFGLIFGADIAQAAVGQGATPANAINAIWVLVFTSNYVVNVAYCAYLVKKHGNFRKLLTGGSLFYWGAAIGMGVLWAGGIVVYGIGATRMGQFGAYVGYPVMLISSILTGNGLGTLAGEWAGVDVKPKRLMTSGVVLLACAIAVLGYSSRLMS